MPITKAEFPILEYDSDPTALLMPNRNEHYALPPRAALLFFGDAVEEYARAAGCKKLGEFVTVTKSFPLYQTECRGRVLCFCQAPVGAAAAVQLLDFLFACGVRGAVAAGSCGALAPLAENEFLVPTEALRCEGASYHYLPPSRTVALGRAGIRAVKAALTRHGLPARECLTWTTDGFFRETKAMVQRRQQEGCAAVEMECAALAACARFRGAEFGQLLFTADTLAGAAQHQDRGWGLASVPLAMALCLEAAAEL